VTKHTWRVPRDAASRLSAFAAICLLVLAVALMLGLTTAFAALYGAVHDLPLGEASRHVRGHLPSLTLAQVLAMGAATVLGLKLSDVDAPPAQALRLIPVRGRSLALCLIAGLCLQFPLAELANALHHYVFGLEPLEEQLARQNLLEAHSLLEGGLVVTCLVALVPGVEELLFRGLFLTGLSGRYGPGWGLVLSSCLFGVIHLGAVPAVYASVAGLLLGGLSLATRSTYPNIALHAGVNAVPVLLPERLIAIHGFNVPSEQPEHLPWWLVWPPLLLGLFLLWVVRGLEARSAHD
jgi:membrane protease YdiL (CAAX protease family)